MTSSRDQFLETAHAIGAGLCRDAVWAQFPYFCRDNISLTDHYQMPAMETLAAAAP